MAKEAAKRRSGVFASLCILKKKLIYTLYNFRLGFYVYLYEGDRSRRLRNKFNGKYYTDMESD